MEEADASTLSARCPACGAQLWRRRGGQWTLGNRIVKLLDDGTIAARCPSQGCEADVPVPFLQIRRPARRQVAVVRVDRRPAP